jgi:hypothetical protein
MLPERGLRRGFRPSPARPGGIGAGVEAMDKLQLEALIFGGEAFDAEATLMLGAAHRVPRHQTLGTRGPVRGVLEEGAMERLDGTEQGRGGAPEPPW